jgi:O-antigen ligase
VILAASVVSAAATSSLAVAAGSFARVGLFAISVYVFLYAAYGPGGALNPVFGVRALLAAGVLAALFACIDFYFQLPAPAGYGPQFVWLDSGVFRRAQGFFYEASTLGNVCVFFLVLIACAAADRERPVAVPAVLLYPAGAVLTAALVFSYSRASIAALASALAALVWIKRRRLALRRWAFLLPIAIAAGAAATYLLFPTFGRVYLMRLLGSFEQFFSATNATLSGRLDNWSAAIEFLIERPWYAVFGVGYKTLPYSEIAGGPLVVDNMYLTLLVETGVAGLAAFLLLNARIFQAAYRASQRQERWTSFFGTWIFCFWAGEMVQMVSGDLFTYWRVLPLYFWVLGTAVRLAR